MGESEASWSVLRSFMSEQCGVHLGADQEYLMESRLAPVAKTLEFETVGDFVTEACRPGASHAFTGPLIDAMTTHETYFFRDAPFWKALAERFLTRFDAGNAPFRVWCAACSTGQEPHTLAMLIDEKFPRLFERLSIVGTDVSEGVLETARHGSYSVFEVNRGITAPRLLRHFDRDGVNFRVKQRLREKISWSSQNLITGNPPSFDFDLILVRNVLIYFQDAVRQRVSLRLREALRSTGILGVGSTETLHHWPGVNLAPGWYALQAF